MSALRLPPAWHALTADAELEPILQGLDRFLAQERADATVYPPPADVFVALALTPPEAVRVVILGQDPYHDEGQAHGLAFSVRRGVRRPPSLRNVFKELRADVGVNAGTSDLRPWARQGVLLLNTVLTVRAHEAASHRGRGWEQVTAAILQAVYRRPEPTVFILWGAHARRHAERVPAHHVVIESPHPSPLSAHRGFFGSRPFSKANAALSAARRTTVDWQL